MTSHSLGEDVLYCLCWCRVVKYCVLCITCVCHADELIPKMIGEYYCIIGIRVPGKAALTHLPHPSWTKWPPLCRQFCQCQMQNFVFCSKSHLSLFLRVDWQKPSIGWDNGLVPNKQQAIIWTNAEPIHWRIYVAQGGDALILKQNPQLWPSLPSWGLLYWDKFVKPALKLNSGHGWWNFISTQNIGCNYLSIL